MFVVRSGTGLEPRQGWNAQLLTNQMSLLTELEAHQGMAYYKHRPHTGFAEEHTHLEATRSLVVMLRRPTQVPTLRHARLATAARDQASPRERRSQSSIALPRSRASRPDRWAASDPACAAS